MNPFGFTRSVLAREHALLTPDSHVTAPLFGWENTSGVTLISPRMGARFTQYYAYLSKESCSLPSMADVERFVFVREGAIRLEGVENGTVNPVLLKEGGYVYLPPGSPIIIAGMGDTGATLLVFEKLYEPRSGFPVPDFFYAQEQEVEAVPFMGDPDARLKTLLPADNPAFDLAVNIFTYQPGATLPNVEVHVMEHGLLMIAGAGVYRLGESYYPVQEGDVIWMAPYCPQWFVAMGKSPARYIYYKDVHRDVLRGATSEVRQ